MLTYRCHLCLPVHSHPASSGGSEARLVCRATRPATISASSRAQFTANWPFRPRRREFFSEQSGAFPQANLNEAPPPLPPSPSPPRSPVTSIGGNVSCNIGSFALARDYAHTQSRAGRHSCTQPCKCIRSCERCHIVGVIALVKPARFSHAPEIGARAHRRIRAR